MTGGDGEVIYELEDEIARKGAPKIRDPAHGTVSLVGARTCRRRGSNEVDVRSE